MLRARVRTGRFFLPPPLLPFLFSLLLHDAIMQLCNCAMPCTPPWLFSAPAYRVLVHGVTTRRDFIVTIGLSFSRPWYSRCVTRRRKGLPRKGWDENAPTEEIHSTSVYLISWARTCTYAYAERTYFVRSSATKTHEKTQGYVQAKENLWCLRRFSQVIKYRSIEKCYERLICQT